MAPGRRRQGDRNRALLLREDRERHVARLRSGLLAAFPPTGTVDVRSQGSSAPPAHGRLLVLGLGRAEVRCPVRGEPDYDSILIIDGAPLVVRAERGVRVLGPPLLARLVARSYREQLGLDAGDERTSIEIGVNPAAPGDGYTGAEVWLGPCGTVCARTPWEARGGWVPLELRL